MDERPERLASDAGAPPFVLLDGKYRLDRELSRGGMGRVYVATHVHLGTRVAVKLLHDDDDGADADAADADDADARGHRRFRQEARAAAQLRHPNVVQVLDYGVDGGRPYLVMELLEGETLRSRLERERALSPTDTAAIVTGIAAALTAAHAAGVVHRDLKPDNVFLLAGDGAPVAKVLDFGVAKLAQSRDGLASAVTTASGAVLGTPAYMSPEQAQGQRDVDAASDRWALGVIAYECLVGARPFTADALGELVLQICAWSLPVPSAHADVPDGFDAWFATACARERDDRFASAREQAAALAALCGGDATLRSGTAAARSTADGAGAPRRAAVPVAATADRAPAAASPRTGRLPMIAAVTALAVAGGVAWWRPWSRAEAPPPMAPSTPAPVTAPAPLAPRLAVLPVDATGDADVALADAATEELIARLAGRPGLRVIARASVMRRRGATDLAATAAELGADRLLVGHLTRADGDVRVALELIDPRDLTVAWTRVYTRPERELESTCALAAADLAVALGGPRPATPTARAPDAYRAYRTGRAYWVKRDHASLLEAIRYFDLALRIDPDYAAAHVGKVDAYLLLPWMGPTPRPYAYTQARAALDRALALAPDSSDAQAARGNYALEADWRFADAEAAYRRAIELDPDNANAHQWLGETLAYAGRFDESLAEIDLAIQLDPLVPAAHKIRGRTLYYMGRFADAVAAADRSLALDPTSPFARYGKGYALVQLGRYDDGLYEIEHDPMFAIPGIEPIILSQRLWVASRKGDRAEVARLGPLVTASRLADLSPFTAGFAAAILGDADAMFRHLERAIREHDPWTVLIAINHEFDPYRGDPRFAALIANFHP